MNEIPITAYIIIIGAMKSGTSSLYEHLIRDHRICPCAIKEPEYFSTKQEHGYNTEKYEALWEFIPEKHEYVIEASTGYSKYPIEKDVAKNIFKYPVRPKIIYIVRNPYERILSHYQHLQNRNYLHSVKPINLRHLIDCSNYYIQLEQYTKYFSLDDILILEFSELIGKPTETVQIVYDFLRLSGNHKPEDYPQVNKTRQLTKLEIMVSNGKLGRFISGMSPGFLKKYSESFIRRLSKAPIKAELLSQERDAIFNSLHKDMKKLNEKYNVVITKWGF